MNRRTKLREEDFPTPGTVFVAPTRDGRLSAGRVLRRQFEGGAQGALIAATPWLGNEPPLLDLPALREILILNHHKWKNQPEMFWVHDVMPTGFTIVGQIALSSDDLMATSYTFGGWHSVPLQTLIQWRWDHDREELLREEALQAAHEAETQRQRVEAHAELMRTLTLDALVDRTWLASWEDADCDLPLNKCRSLLAKLVNELRAAPTLTMAVARRHLKQSVKDMNRLDAEQHFIFTIEREDLFDAYEQILCAAKFPQVANQIDNWREW